MGINDPGEINTELQDFHKKPFTDNLSISKKSVVSLLKDLSLPKLQEKQSKKCEGEIKGSELLKSVKKKKKDKSSGNDGLTKEFYETFWAIEKSFFSRRTKNL